MKTILKDKTFKKGFNIGHIDSNNHHDDVLPWKFGFCKPTWKLCQWFSNFSLFDESKKEQNKKQGFFKISNAQKEIIRDGNGAVTLTILADKEYTHDRVDGEPWPHLLIEQFFTGINVSKLNNLHAEIDFDFLSFKSHMKKPGELHTFQISWYFCIVNRNKCSEGKDDFFWFGLPFIDTPRLPMGKPYEAADYGKDDATCKYIINLDPKSYISKPTEPGDKLTFKGDVLPELKKAFKKAQLMGYLKTSKWEDMELASTNFGIEDTGAFDGSIRINKIDIYEE